MLAVTHEALGFIPCTVEQRKHRQLPFGIYSELAWDTASPRCNFYIMSRALDLYSWVVKHLHSVHVLLDAVPSTTENWVWWCVPVTQHLGYSYRQADSRSMWAGEVAKCLRVLVLFQRTQVWIPACIVVFTTACNSSHRESDTLFWPPWTPGMHIVHRYTHRQNTHRIK